MGMALVAVGALGGFMALDAIIEGITGKLPGPPAFTMPRHVEPTEAEQNNERAYQASSQHALIIGGMAR